MPDKQWHPLFVTAVREALSDALPGQVDVQAEVALSSRPLDIDVLVVKKDKDARLSHPMAGVFRRYNVFEFKGPEDYLAPNDYYKGMALALLYKALKHEGLLTLDDFTITFVSKRHPREFLKMVRLRKDLQLEDNSPVPGIHQIYGEGLPVQVLVLNGLTEPEDTYMFSPFLTGREPLRLDTTKLLFRKRIDHPDNPYVEELVEFKLKNELMIQEEMEVLARMIPQMNTAERARMREALQSNSLIRGMIETLAMDKAKTEAKQEVISKFLLRRFNAESPEIQRQVQQLNDSEVLDNVLTDLFASTSLEEAQNIIAGAVKKLPGKSEP